MTTYYNDYNCRPSYGWQQSGSTASGSGGISGIDVYDEGNLVLGAATCINFVGATVVAQTSSLSSSCVFVYIPPPTYPSHWTTTDGVTDGTVTDPTSTTSQRISYPTSEGNPFRAKSWPGSNHLATLNPNQTFTSAEDTLGFGGDSTVTVRVVDASGSDIDSYTTSALTANGTYTSGAFSLALSNYGTTTDKFSGSMAVTVDAVAVFESASMSGGVYQIHVSHSTDSATDGGQLFAFATTEAFYDTNETTPSVSGDVGIQEQSGSILTKHLSGIEYYITNSAFEVSVSGVYNFNNNTQATSNNLRVRGDDYGLTAIYAEPFGAESGSFDGWNDIWNDSFATFNSSSWKITQSNYRFVGPTANADARPRDGWANGSTINSSNASVLVDTYGVTSTALIEYFNDEDRRLESDFTTSWDSEIFLSGSGTICDALVENGKLQNPDRGTFVGEASTVNADWTTYKPDKNGTNPDYTGVGLGTYLSGAQYFRAFPDTSGLFRPNMQIVFAGTFASGSALNDLMSGNLDVYVRKFSGSIGQGGSGSFALNVHGNPFNSPDFNDGVDNGSADYAQVRLNSSSGNTINCTFGTFTMLSGTYWEVRVRHEDTRVDTITVSYS